MFPLDPPSPFLKLLHWTTLSHTGSSYRIEAVPILPELQKVLRNSKIGACSAQKQNTMPLFSLCLLLPVLPSADRAAEPEWIGPRAQEPASGAQ